MTQALQKSELRQRFRAARLALSADAVESRSAQIAELFWAYIFRPEHRYIHSFLSIASNHEPNTWPIIEQLWQEHPQVRVVAPRVHRPTKTLQHLLIEPDTVLHTGGMSIPEPPNDALPIAIALLDVILVPLYCFDERGYRVGYGGGYYDKFLAQCAPKTLKVGISLLPPVAVIEGIAPYDIPLDYCLTPDKVWRFAQL
ncbi:5-formyltetrahydrofolate cyclo-ligase [Eisenibacter elegans]|jgi:5-formyltetrahydrofolate cyclo-ligase|uniref:5-formyltetrahydrofolate cyclo-ligase n=1 Tax=Eisenibacter elegans TaxID=997 RepID=UPI0004157FCE|nr:5-formyltetrahydrofolate cyclo-ligase [Eisenibacter elegans]